MPQPRFPDDRAHDDRPHDDRPHDDGAHANEPEVQPAGSDPGAGRAAEIAEDAPTPAEAAPDSLDRWTTAVSGANEPCIVINSDARIVAASEPCYELLGLGEPGSAVGRFLLDGVLQLVDFTAARDELTDVEVDKIPPLLALSSGRLARGLMRVHDGADFDATVDAIATPLCDGPTVVGSLTFFSPI